MTKQQVIDLFMSGNQSSKQDQIVYRGALPHLIIEREGHIIATTNDTAWALWTRRMHDARIIDRNNLKGTL